MKTEIVWKVRYIVSGKATHGVVATVVGAANESEAAKAVQAIYPDAKAFNVLDVDLEKITILPE